MQISQNQALYALLGKTFGGDAKTTFGLPDLQGRAPLCDPNFGGNQQGNQFMGGAESVTLTTKQVPIHTHSFKALSTVGTANQPTAGANLVSSAKPVGTPAVAPLIYGAVTATTTPSNLQPLNSGTVNTVGGGAHDNMQPFIVMNFCIATTGLWPDRP